MKRTEPASGWTTDHYYIYRAVGLTISAKHMATLTGPACRATLMQVNLNSILYILSLIYYCATMLCHHKASLSLFFICPSNNVVIRQTFIVLISYITIQQCSGTTELHCPHSFNPIQQCCDTTKLHCTHFIY